MKESSKEPQLQWHERKIILHQYELTDGEKIELARKMSEAKAGIIDPENELDAVKKEYREKISAPEGELTAAARQFKSGLADFVEVECDIYQDFDTEEMVYLPTQDGAGELYRVP